MGQFEAQPDHPAVTSLQEWTYREESRIIALIEQVSGYDKEVHALRLSRFQRHTERAAERIRQLQRKKLADQNLFESTQELG